MVNRIGTDVFDRLKVGVGPVPQNIPIDSFVLGNFTNDELINVNKMAKVAVDLVDLIEIQLMWEFVGVLISWIPKPSA